MIRKFVLMVLLLLVTTNLWAAKTFNVAATKHNLGSTSSFGAGTYRATNEDEVCIFCHTPHSGALNTPLWNRALPDQSAGSEFTHYSSATLSSYFTGLETRALNPESLLCMSCHDGTVGVGTLLNNSNRTGGPPDNEAANIAYMFGPPGSSIGDSWINDMPNRDLRDDHPISFSYYEVKATSAGAKLHTVIDARNAGVRFFGPTAVANGDRMECSTCHDPHVNGNVDSNFNPFLQMSNNGSALCLACHIK